MDCSEAVTEIRLSDLPGKVMLVGITYYTHDDQFIEQKRYFGEVVEANDRLIRIRRDNGEFFTIPPDLRSTYRAKPGEYRLRSTGEIVVNPDYLSMWNIHKSEPEDVK